jgi:hypothetical protein
VFLQVALDLIQPLAMRAFQPGQTYEIPDGKQEGIDHFSHVL